MAAEAVGFEGEALLLEGLLEEVVEEAPKWKIVPLVDGREGKTGLQAGTFLPLTPQELFEVVDQRRRGDRGREMEINPHLTPFGNGETGGRAH